MAVVAADLIAPAGLIELFMFPGDTQATLEERLTSYIADADALGSPSDAATRSWAYYRAFTAVYIRLSTNPEKVEVTDEGGHAWGARQADRVKQMADEQRAIWDGLIVDEDLPAGRPRGSTPTRFTW